MINGDVSDTYSKHAASKSSAVMTSVNEVCDVTDNFILSYKSTRFIVRVNMTISLVNGAATVQYMANNYVSIQRVENPFCAAGQLSHLSRQDEN